MKPQREVNHMSLPPICPRCRGFIPSNERPGEYAGAGSRLTNDRGIEICSACGQDEAVGRGLVPQEAWPILTRTSVAANVEPSYSETITEQIAPFVKATVDAAKRSE